MSRIYSPLYNFFNILHKKIISKKKYYSFGGIDIIVDYIFKTKKWTIYRRRMSTPNFK